MKLAIFNDHRLGVVSPDQTTVTDVTAALPYPWDSDPLNGGWWRLLCRDFADVRERLAVAATTGPPIPLEDVRLLSPALTPSKIIAAAANYPEHVEEFGGKKAGGWLLEFDVFLKAPSSIVGPDSEILLPAKQAVRGAVIHHESELALVIEHGGSHIPSDSALNHVLGYLNAIDVTVRGTGDRSHRKSYDSFTPLGPWITTRDEVPNPDELPIELMVNGAVRQSANSRDLIVDVPGIISYASSIMSLSPGDVILTGSPAGVGALEDKDRVSMTIGHLGRLALVCRRESDEASAT